MKNEVLSPDYPKWMRKSGARDIQVHSPEEEAKFRDDGYSHEVIVSEQKPPLGSSAPPPAAEVKPPAGSVPTGVLDGMLEAQSERFQKTWEKKCAEMAKLQSEHATLASAHANLAAEHDKLTEAHKALNDEHAALSKEHANLLKERNEELRAKKVGPIVPPVAKA